MKKKLSTFLTAFLMLTLTAYSQSRWIASQGLDSNDSQRKRTALAAVETMITQDSSIKNLKGHLIECKNQLQLTTEYVKDGDNLRQSQILVINKQSRELDYYQCNEKKLTKVIYITGTAAVIEAIVILIIFKN